MSVVELDWRKRMKNKPPTIIILDENDSIKFQKRSVVQ